MIRSICLILALGLVAPARGAEPSGRVPWTTSRFRGAPEPPRPYTIERAFPHLAFRQPVELTPAPGSRRLFVVELAGKIYSFINDPACPKPDLFFDLLAHQPQTVQTYGLAFHPRYPDVPYIYLCYVLQGEKPDGTRVSRFTVRRTEPPTVDPASEQLLLTWLAGGHNGNTMKFGPDGYLYISTGDGTGPSPPDVLSTGQDCSDLLSSILRIDVDRADPGRHYGVPSDNPFVNRPSIRPEIWAFGFRNPWKISFDRARGDLWVGDVGWDTWELIYRVVRGGNYGWSIMEGSQVVRPTLPRGPTPILPPVYQHPHNEARSITGGFVYRGKRLPELVGSYVYGDFATGKIWALKETPELTVRELVETRLPIVSFGEDNSGELFIVEYEPGGRIFRLMPNPEKDESRQFPRRLSQTGLFRTLTPLVPADGVIPYSIIAPYWADGAVALRHLAIPGEGRLNLDDSGRVLPPPGTVVARTVAIPGKSAQGRLETQILHLENGSWRPYSYAWNESQSEATLVGPEGTEIAVDDARYRAVTGSAKYRVVSRAECGLCHAAALDSTLGLRCQQLAREVNIGRGPENQMDAWKRLGLWAQPVADAVRKRPHLVDPDDAKAPLEARARSYLHANCYHCHRIQGAGTATIRLEFGMPQGEMLAIDVAPAQGNFGLTGGKIIAAGRPLDSVLLLRMAKSGAGHMPHLGAATVHGSGVRLMEDWIRSLPAKPHDASAAEEAPLQRLDAAALSDTDQRKVIQQLLGNTRGAFALALALERDVIPPSIRKTILQEAASRAEPMSRDLLDRFLPPEARLQRLGANFDRRLLLSAKGDVEAGRRLFLTGSLSCRNCHRVAGAGGQIGPDLSQIGKKYDDRAKLLVAILEPSREIESKYRAHLAVTTAGATVLGLLIEDTPGGIVLRDAQGSDHRIARADIEAHSVQTTSLMPEGLFNDLTREQAADLLAFLASLR